MNNHSETGGGVTIARRIDSKYSAALIGNRVEIVKADTGEVLPRDEPLILFRGKDRLLVELLRVYRRMCIAVGCPQKHLFGIESETMTAEIFATSHPERMKTPD